MWTGESNRLFAGQGPRRVVLNGHYSVAASSKPDQTTLHTVARGDPEYATLRYGY